MRSTIVHFSALNRLAAPTPMIDAEILCVVDTGIPKCDARPMITAELVSAANPLTGCRWTILCPSVLMIRQPPPAVPAAITSAHITLIQSAMGTLCPGSGGGTSRNESQPGRFANRPAAVADASARATIPIVFCASFVPCISPIPMALNNWAFPKKMFTVRGFQLRSSAYNNPMTVNPSTNPSSGDANIGITTFQSSPLLGYQCAASGTDQMTTLQLRAAATAAPTSPPTNAWLELLGSPACQVTRFQTMAPSSAQISTSCEATFGSMSPEAIVDAT